MTFKIPSWMLWLSGVFLLLILVIFIATKASSDNEPEEYHSSIFALPVDRLVVINLHGIIAEPGDEGLFGDMSSIAEVKHQLRHAYHDKHIKGVLFRIDSPGGTIATSQEIHDLVDRIKLTGKPIVASFSDVAGSGGYYVACSCDSIFAEPGTITGSIGVIANLYNLQAIEHKLGVEPQTIKSGTFKDMGSPDRALTAKEKILIQQLIMDNYHEFVQAVASGRKMPLDKVLKLADGRVYSGRQALSLGLVDHLGGYDQSLLTLQKLTNERFHHEGNYPVQESTTTGILSRLLGLSDTFSVLKLTSFLPKPVMVPRSGLPLWIMQ